MLTSSDEVLPMKNAESPPSCAAGKLPVEEMAMSHACWKFMLKERETKETGNTRWYRFKNMQTQQAYMAGKGGGGVGRVL